MQSSTLFERCIMKVKKKDSRLWHIAKKYANKRVGRGIIDILKPVALSDDGMFVTIMNTRTLAEQTFNMEQFVRIFGVPNNGKYEFQELPHKGY